MSAFYPPIRPSAFYPPIHSHFTLSSVRPEFIRQRPRFTLTLFMRGHLIGTCSVIYSLTNKIFKSGVPTEKQRYTCIIYVV